MSFDVFLNFDGDCREALRFYSAVFMSEPSRVMTYAEAGMEDIGGDRVIYANLPVFGHNIMFSDCPEDSEYVKGTNICLTLGCDDKAEVDRLFTALSEGGEIDMPIGETFFSEYYCMVTDKFGITWQLTLTVFGE